MKNKVAQLAQWIEEAQHVTFFGGAGVSTESGISDFRSAEGVYSQALDYHFSPEELVSHSAYCHHPEVFYDFYKSHLVYPRARPNAAHLELAALEAQGKLKAVITQNIDTLHEQAGSQQVIKLHGSVDRNRCVSCGKQVELMDFLLRRDAVPRCDCGGIIKPEVVLYEEPLPEGVMDRAADLVEESDLLIVGGTSLSVYPAASLLQYFKGAHLVLINREPTIHDRFADLVIQEPIGEVFAALAKHFTRSAACS